MSHIAIKNNVLSLPGGVGIILLVSLVLYF